MAQGEFPPLHCQECLDELLITLTYSQSYEADQYFDFSEENIKKGTIFKQELYDAIPKDVERRMGNLKETYDAFEPLELGDWKKFGYEKGGDDVSYVQTSSHPDIESS